MDKSKRSSKASLSTAASDEAVESSPANQSAVTMLWRVIRKVIRADGTTAELCGSLPWVIAAVIVVAAQATLFLVLGPGDKLTAYTYVTLFLLILTATGAATLNALGGKRGSRSFWALFALGMGIWALDQWLWIYYHFWLHTDVPNESMGEPALFLHTIPLMAALVTGPHLEASRRRLHQTTFSFLLLLFFWVFLYAYYVFPYQFLIRDPLTYWFRYNSLYLCENLALLFLAGILILRSERPWKSVYAHVFGAAGLYALTSEQVNAAITIGGPYYVGGIYDWGLTATACWFILAAIRGRNMPPVSRRPWQVSTRLAKYAGLLSILGVVIVPLMGIWALYRADTSLHLQQVHLLIILLFAIIFTTLVFLQMYAANLDLQREIAVRLKAEEALCQSEEKYRSLVSNIPDVVWTVDSELRFVFISKNIERVSGFSLNEVYQDGAQLYLASLHPDDVHKVRDGFRALFAEGRPFDVECRVKRKGGNWIWVHDRALATYEKNGIRYADGLLSDITERKRAEMELRRVNRALRTISECNQGIVRATEESHLLEDICGILVREGGYRMAWVGYGEHDEGKSVRPMAHVGFEEGYLQTLA